MSSSMKKICLLIFIFCVASFPAKATCTLDKSDATYLQAPLNITMPMSHNSISGGVDVAVGTILFKMTYRSAIDKAKITCNTTGRWYIERGITSTPLALSTYSDSNYPTVYESGLPGIGIAIGSFPSTQDTTGVMCITGRTYCDYGLYSGLAFDLLIIKTGDITSGTLNATSFPSIYIAVGKNEENMVKIAYLNFSGSIELTQPTCVSPDKQVDLGKWTISRFTGKGSTTPWVDSSIKLTNCGNFKGMVTGANTWNEKGTGVPAIAAPNNWSVSFSSVYGDIDAANGIISVAQDAGSATGVGIQLGDTQTGQPVNLTTSLTGQLAENVTEQEIPLRARIIQTEDSVTPGAIISKVLFNISYL